MAGLAGLPSIKIVGSSYTVHEWFYKIINDEIIEFWVLEARGWRRCWARKLMKKELEQMQLDELQDITNEFMLDCL